MPEEFDDRPVRVDIWSDVACPWCYIGKRKFEVGADAFTASNDVEVEVVFHSFELAPDTPVDFAGSEIDFLVRHKGFSPVRVNDMLTRVTEIAASVGLAYDFDALQHTNTRLAHELLHHAKQHGVQPAMKERLLRAYFVEGRHVGRVADLADLAADVGLDRAEVARALAAHEHAAEVDADTRQAREYGITGVPFFVLDGALGVSGAQEPETFAKALARALEERRGQTTV
jgi:predicted DsbA family dithiol-disulfide isomerase